MGRGDEVVTAQPPEILSPDFRYYRPLAILKRGRSSTVSLVQDVHTGKRFVARLLRPPHVADVRLDLPAFQATARTLERLKHPGVQAFAELIAGQGGTWFLSAF